MIRIGVVLLRLAWGTGITITLGTGRWRTLLLWIIFAIWLIWVYEGELELGNWYVLVCGFFTRICPARLTRRTWGVGGVPDKHWGRDCSVTCFGVPMRMAILRPLVASLGRAPKPFIKTEAGASKVPWGATGMVGEVETTLTGKESGRELATGIAVWKGFGWKPGCMVTKRLFVCAAGATTWIVLVQLIGTAAAGISTGDKPIFKTGSPLFIGEELVAATEPTTFSVKSKTLPSTVDMKFPLVSSKNTSCKPSVDSFSSKTSWVVTRSLPL